MTGHDSHPHAARRRARPPRGTRLTTLALLAGAAGCHVWQPDARPVTAVVRDAPATIRLTSHQGDVLVLGQPRLVTDTTRAAGTAIVPELASDTLVAGRVVSRALASGTQGRLDTRQGAPAVMRISDVQRAEVRRVSPWRTTALVAAAGALIAIIVGTHSDASGGGY